MLLPLAPIRSEDDDDVVVDDDVDDDVRCTGQDRTLCTINLFALYWLSAHNKS